MKASDARYLVPEEWSKKFEKQLPLLFWKSLKTSCNRDCLRWFLYKALGSSGKSILEEMRKLRREEKSTQEACADALRVVGKTIPALRKLLGTVPERSIEEQINRAFAALRAGGQPQPPQPKLFNGPTPRLDLEQLVQELEAWKSLLSESDSRIKELRVNRPDRGKRLKPKFMILVAAWEIRKCAGLNIGNQPTLNEIAQVIQAALSAHGSEAVATADSLRVAFHRHPEIGSTPAYCLNGRPSEQ